MRIGILVAGLAPERMGGAELQATRAAEGLAARHDVTVLARVRKVPEALANAPRCRVIPRPAPGLPGLRFAVDVVGSLMLLFRLRRTLDVVLAYQTVIDGLIGVLAKRAFGIPVVVSVRGATEYELDRLSQRLFGPFVFRHADRLLVQSPAIARELLAAFQARSGDATAASLRSRLGVVPNGIDVPTETPSDPRTVLFVGRLMAGKGVHFLIEAMRACPDEVLIVVGDGPERGRLEALAKGLANVTFAGVADRRHLDDHFARARMLVLPSLQEGQPNVVMEAMVRGVPVVASRVGGLPDLIRDGQTGLLVEPGNVAGLAAAIRRLAAEPELRRIIAERARREMEQYRWDRVLVLLENQLQKAARPRREPVGFEEKNGRT